MPLQLPPAITVPNLIGGYNSAKNFTTLENNETNDAKNIEISERASAKKRDGFQRRLNDRITNPTSADVYSNGEPITGHFQLVKLSSASTIKAEIVGAGNSLFTYSDSGYSAIATGLTDNSAVYWDFAQIQDPRSASDDIVIATNGVDAMKIWNGVEASAVNLNAITSATQVPIAKFVASLQNRIYALNIEDNTEVDSKVKVFVSDFDPATGAPRPQRFTQSFFVGGSDQFGEITGKAILNDQLIIFKQNATYKFTPGAGRLIDTASLIQMDEQIGCIAPNSVATVGNIAIFLSSLGPYLFDGNSFLYIGHEIEQEMNEVNRSLLKYATGRYYKDKNQYWLAIPTDSNTRNQRIFVFDIRRRIWFPPYSTINTHILSSYRDSNDNQFLLICDHQGYIYKADTGTADGMAIGYVGAVDSYSGLTITDSDANFNISGDGLAGQLVMFELSSGQILENTITTNTSNTITIDVCSDSINSNTSYIIGGIDSYYRTPDFDYGLPEIDKLFRRVTMRLGQEGDRNLNVNWIVDQRALPLAGSGTIQMLTDGMVWGTHQWGARRWGGSAEIQKALNLKPIPTQPIIGKYFALRFGNKNPNEPFQVFGFDISAKQVGRRRN